MFKYLTIHPDKVPKDLPFDTKIISRRIQREGVDMGDPKLRWTKVDYHIFNLVKKVGTLKKGTSTKDLGEIICYNFYSKPKAVENAYYYKNNPRYIGNPFQRIILIKMIPLPSRVSSELAVRFVLKQFFGFKSIYGGWPFILGYSKAKDWKRK